MSRPKAVDKDFNIDFQWGQKKGVGTTTDVQFYESFTYDGVDYSLFDCVYLWCDEQAEPDIGVIVKIWETPSYAKKVKVVWFFRPSDISNFLGDDTPLKNEIFLASGEGKGLANLNSLLAIAGKCNVVCTSKNKSNPQASDAELRMADFIFYRTFDVGTYMLSDKFPDRIAGIKVECFYNKKKDQKPVSDPKFKQSSKEGADKVRNWKSSCLASTENQPFKKRKLLSDFGDSSGLCKDSGVKPENQLFEVTRNANADTNRWFKQLPWEERMKKAHEQGTLVFLENLDPSYTSSEVEDIVWQALNERVDAKMIQRSTCSSPHSGKAFVIFKSKVVAETVINKLRRRCLMLPTGRPLIAYIRTPTEPDKAATLVGHLELNRTKLRPQRKEMRDAVATSHCSQPNNIEYDMAVKWCRLQEQTDAWWNALHEKQASEIKELKSHLKYTPKD